MGANVNLPYDNNAGAVQVLAPEESSVVQIVIGAGNASQALPSGAAIVEVAASDLCRIKFGTSSVDATIGTSRLFPIGVSVYKVPKGATHMSVTRIGTTSGFVTIAKMA